MADQIVAELMPVVDEVIKELVEPIERVGNPEKLIGKPYEMWTPEDIQMLFSVYGSGPNTPMARLILEKEWAQVEQLRHQVEPL